MTIRVCEAMNAPVGRLSDRTVCEANGGVLPRQVLIDPDGRTAVSDVMKNKTSSRTLPQIRLNPRLLAEMVGILPRAKQQPTGLIACGLRAAALFSSAPSLPQKRHQPEPVPFVGGDGGIRTHVPG